MRFTTSIKQNRDFRRLYSKGISYADRFLVIYRARNRLGILRLGITVSSKLGGAVVRNRVRRRIKEAYRLNEAGLVTGFDVVIVARTMAVNADFKDLQKSLVSLFVRHGMIKKSYKGGAGGFK